MQAITRIKIEFPRQHGLRQPSIRSGMVGGNANDFKIRLGKVFDLREDVTKARKGGVNGTAENARQTFGKDWCIEDCKLLPEHSPRRQLKPVQCA